MIELAEGFWVAPDAVSAIKAISKSKCVLWTAGQPGSDGHVLDYSAEDVVEVINEYLGDGTDDDTSDPE